MIYTDEKLFFPHIFIFNNPNQTMEKKDTTFLVYVSRAGIP